MSGSNVVFNWGSCARHVLHDRVGLIAAHEAALSVRAAVPVCPIAFLMAAEAILVFSSAVRDRGAGETEMIPPTPRPPPAFHVRPSQGRDNFQKKNLPFCVLPILPMSVQLIIQPGFAWPSHANFCAYIGGHPREWLAWSPRDRAFPRCRLFRWRKDCAGPFDPHKKSSRLSASASFGKSAAGL